MSTIDVTVDQKPADHNPPIDPNVIIPDHVKRAAALAESYYAKPAEPVAEAAPEPAEPVAEAAPEPAPVVEAPPTVPVNHEYVTPTKQEIHESDWAARYNSMKGRYEASQRTIGSMQEQMSQLGDELMRTQQLLRGQAPEQRATPHSNNKLITAEDEQAYGPELIDFARRAAQEAVGPEIEQLRAENQKLHRSQITRAQGELKQRLSDEMPNWREINNSPEFIQWLRLPNVYTGQVRKQMLDAAYAAADAPKVAAFFKDFLREGDATGQRAPAATPEQPKAPRQAAMSLDVLAAPGRARPASGEFSAPADKPIFTRAQIADFYTHVRRGAYAGRETEKARQEAAIFSAQAEGRVR